MKKLLLSLAASAVFVVSAGVQPVQAMDCITEHNPFPQEGFIIGFDYFNFHGMQERWVRTYGNRWYFVLPNGEFHRWDYSTHSQAEHIATVPRRYYDNIFNFHTWFNDLCPTTSNFIVDDGDADFSTDGVWNTFNLMGYDGDITYTPGQIASDSVEWSHSNLPAGPVDVHVTWVPLDSLAPSVWYSVYVDDVFQFQRIFGQVTAPNSNVFDGTQWQHLGQVVIPEGAEVRVEATAAGQQFMADAVRFEVPAIEATAHISTEPIDLSPFIHDTSVQTVKNAVNQDLIRFRVRAGSGKDILFTSASFEAQTGSLLNGQNYILWYDSNNDGTVDTPVHAAVQTQSGLVRFTALLSGGVLIPAGESRVFQVHADMASSIQPTNALQLQFAHLSLPNTFFEAEDADTGAAVDADINYSLNGGSFIGCAQSTCNQSAELTDAIPYFLHPNGDVVILNTVNNINSSQLLAGTITDVLFELDVQPSHEAVGLTQIQISASGAVGSIEELLLYKDGSATPFDTATIADCSKDLTSPTAAATFCSNSVGVPAFDRLVSSFVQIRARLRTDSDGAASGERFALFIDPTPNFGSGYGAVSALGLESGMPLKINNGNNDVKGKIFVGTPAISVNRAVMSDVFETVLVQLDSIDDAHGDSDDDPIPVGIDVPVATFSFAAGLHGNSALGNNEIIPNRIIFNIDTNNTAHSGYSLRVKSTGAVAPCGAPSSLSGSATVTCDLSGLPHALRSVPMAGSTDFELRAQVISGGIGAYYQVSLGTYNTPFAPFGLGQNHIEWIDADSGTAVTHTWFDYSTPVVESVRYSD